MSPSFPGDGLAFSFSRTLGSLGIPQHATHLPFISRLFYPNILSFFPLILLLSKAMSWVPPHRWKVDIGLHRLGHSLIAVWGFLLTQPVHRQPPVLVCLGLRAFVEHETCSMTSGGGVQANKAGELSYLSTSPRTNRKPLSARF